MSIASPLKAPKTYDAPTLDGQRMPGVTEIDGGDAKEKVEDQQQPLTKGANTVVRGTENSVVSYTVRVWTEVDWQAFTGTWIPMFMAGRARVPNPRVYQFVDLRVPWVQRVIFESISPQKTEKPGGPWSWKLVLHQYNRVAPYGGPLRPPDELDAQILANNKTIAGLSGQLAGPVAATKTYDPNAYRKGGA